MARLKVEDFALADVPEHAAAVVFAFVPFLFEEDQIGGGDVEGFIVHFIVHDVPGFGEAFGDRMIGGERGDVGGFAGFAPGGEDAVGEIDVEGNRAVGVGVFGEAGGEGGVAFDAGVFG